MLLSHLWLLVSWFLSLSLYPQGCFLTMTVSWYQSLIKVLLSRFPQSCRHFHNAETGTQYLVRPSLLPTRSRLPFLGPLPAVASPCVSLMVLSSCSLLLLVQCKVCALVAQQCLPPCP